MSPEKDATKTHFRFAAGVSYGMLLGSSIRFNGYQPTGTRGPLVDVTEEYETAKFDYGKSGVLSGVTELSINFLAGKSETPFFIRARHAFTFDSVYENNSSYPYNLSTKMSTWTFAFGIYFMDL
jgi:hypothetical protein